MSYISSLNLLGSDSPAEITEESLAEELSLWANAQFTFDTEPGSALLDDSKPAAASNDQRAYDLFASLNQIRMGDMVLPSSGSGTDQNISGQAPASVLQGQQAQQQATPFILPDYLIQQQQQQQQQQRSSQKQNELRLLPRIAPAPSGAKVDPLTTTPSWAMQPTTSVSTTTTSLTTSRKRKQPSSSSDSSMDAAERAAAEEDKRRRNTAASARFRMKKKLREQALEQTAKEMTSKAEALEKRVQELEMEAKWLRALVIEKDPRLLDIVQKPVSESTSSSSSS